MMNKVRSYFALLSVSGLLMLVVCGGYSSGDSTPNRDNAFERGEIPRIQPTAGKPPKQGRPVQWVLLGTPQGRQLRIRTGFLSYCVEIPRSKPRITAVRERLRRDGIVLTAYVVGGYQPGCAAVVVRPEAVVNMKQPLGDEQLFDGSKTPPIKRWPK